MDFKDCCGTGSNAENGKFEVVRIEKTETSCRLCEDYARSQQEKPVAVLSCEGACLRGEVSRQAANILCHELAPEKTARICLGGAFTKEGGQRDLVRNGGRVLAVEGCRVNCASRMMRGVIPELRPEIVAAHALYDFDVKLFGIDEMDPEEIRRHGRTVAEKIAATL